jgi:hypothetical protein
VKKLIMLGSLIVLLAALGSRAVAGAEPAPAPTPQEASPPAPAPCTPAKQIYALKHWRTARPARGEHVCETRARDLRKLKEAFGEYRLYRAVAPFRGPIGHGPRSPADQRYWAIPWCVVAGESGGSWWPSPNAADRAYQIIPSTFRSYTPSRHEERSLERRYQVSLSFGPDAASSSELENHIVARNGYLGGTAWYGGCTAN